MHTCNGAHEDFAISNFACPRRHTYDIDDSIDLIPAYKGFDTRQCRPTTGTNQSRHGSICCCVIWKVENSLPKLFIGGTRKAWHQHTEETERRRT